MADPKYQFPNRWAEIGGLLFPEPTPEQQRALSLLEQKDRDAEDHWGSSGGTLQSIIAVASSGVNGSWDVGSSGVSGSNSDLSVAVPDDASFDYYLDWRIHGVAFLINNETSAAGLFFQGFAKIAEQSPGAGYERHGWYETAPAEVANGTANPFTRYYLTGNGNRIEQVTPDHAGTTIHLEISYTINADSVDTGQFTIDANAVLIAIPK